MKIISCLFQIQLLIFIIFFSNSVIAETCEQVNDTCIEGPETRIIQGQEFHKDCWKYRKNIKCYSNNYDNSCDILRNNNCDQINSECAEVNHIDQICNQYRDGYVCPSLIDIANQTNITHIDDNYTIIRQELNHKQCQQFDNNNQCHFVSSECIEGEETRSINGLDVTRSCWRYKYNYSCLTGNHQNSCQNIPENCHLSHSQCLIRDDNDNAICHHQENSYLCTNNSSVDTNSLQCGINTYCINGQCETPETPKSKDFGSTIAYLQAINQMAKDNNQSSTDLKIFTGETQKCSRAVLGFNNCCVDSGWGHSISLASCNEEEKRLAKLQEKKVCHYVGSYCSNKNAFGICLAIKKSYCCFNSKLSRIIVEQGRNQLSMSWGDAESPDCRGFTTDEIQSLKFDQMDLSEAISDIAQNIKIPNPDQFEGKVQQFVDQHPSDASNNKNMKANSTIQNNRKNQRRNQ